MKVLIGTDSRGNLPRANAPIGTFNKNWVDFVFGDYRQNQDTVRCFRHSNEVFVFTLAQFKHHILNNLGSEIFDLAILQCGWHELIAPWPTHIQKSFYPTSYDDRHIVGYTADKCHYYNVQEIKDIVFQIKQISRHQLFIGMHSLKGIPPEVIGGPIVHDYILESNRLFSSLDVDFFWMPNDPNWALSYGSPDKIHYMEHATAHVAEYINRYINRLDKTLVSVLLERGQDKTTRITINDITTTYSDLIEEARSLGSSVAKQTNGGDKVLIALGTSYEQVALFLGCILYGRVPVLVQPVTSKVQNSILAQKLQSIKDSVSPAIAIVEKNDEELFRAYFNVVDIVASKEVLELPIVCLQDTAFIQLSSGTTTGIPTPVEVSHKQILAHCDEYADFIGMKDYDYISSWLPIYHDMGLIACLLLPVVKGVGFSHIDPFRWLMDDDLLYKDIEKNSTTFVWLPNFAIAKMLAKKPSRKIDLSSIRKLISCSEPVSYNTMQRFVEEYREFGIKDSSLATCYALAENIFAVSYAETIKDNEGVVSCGKILPGTSVMIIKDGEDVTATDVGEICIRSSYEPTIYSGERTQYGHYMTGDIGYIKDEELFVVGRVKDKIVSYGVNHMPYQIEETVSQISGVVPGRVTCFGLYDDKLGTEQVVVALEAESSGDIKNNVFSLTSNVVHKCFIVPPGYLVKTSSGKISRVLSKEKMKRDGHI